MLFCPLDLGRVKPREPFRQVILIDLLSFMKPNRGKYRPCSSALYSLTLCFDATFTFILCQEGWHRPALSLFAKVSLDFSCKLPKATCFQKFAFAKRSGAMKAPVGLLSDRTVLRSKMEGPRPDKFAFAKRSAAMKAPVGLLSDRTVLRSKMEGSRPDKFTLTRLDFYGNLSQQLNITYFYIFVLALRG